MLHNGNLINHYTQTMGGRRAKPEEKASAIALYREGVFITEIAARTGFGTTTIFRWATEAGVIQPFSERLASGSKSRQFGREHIGKKGVFHTSKGGAWIPTDSTYEAARLVQLEGNPSVVRLDRCRDRIPYIFDGVKRSYIPDFRIELSCGLVIVEEVKPTRWVADPKVQAKVRAAQEHYKSIGVVFRVITDADIGSENLAAAFKAHNDNRSSEAIDAARERRLAQRRDAQKAYTARKRSTATPEQLAEMRAKNAAFQREYRKRNKKAS